MSARNGNQNTNRGTVVFIRGSVVDAHFPNRLPTRYHVLHTGDAQRIVIEVIVHLDEKTVRGIALTSTRGLARGACIVDTGQPLQVPGGEWRSSHRQPVALTRQATMSEIFETGIKAIDVLAPLERGGKAGLFGGAGVGKTVLILDMRR